MPYIIRGIGTAFCGQRDFRSDGSYLTTEWITVIIPLIPIRSLRVLYWYQPPGFWVFPECVVTEVGRPCWKQVASVYAFLLFLLPLPIVPLALLERATTVRGATIAVVLLAIASLIPAIVPKLLRHRARRRLQPCPSPPQDSRRQTISLIHVP